MHASNTEQQAHTLVLDVSYYLYAAKKIAEEYQIKLDSNIFFIELMEASSLYDYNKCIFNSIFESHFQAFIEEHGIDLDSSDMQEKMSDIATDLSEFFKCLGLYQRNGEHFYQFDKWLSPDVVVIAERYTDYELDTNSEPDYDRPCMFTVKEDKLATFDRLLSAQFQTRQFRRFKL